MRPGDENDMQRVFVVGMARSGTTLIQSVLNAHSKILSFPETHFLSKTIYLPKHLRFLPITNSGVRHANGILEELGATLLQPGLRFYNKIWVKELFTKLDELALMHGYKVWVEKTPLHLMYIELISKAFPSAQFIHVVRNPVDSVNSLLKASKQHPEHFVHGDINKAIKRCHRDLSESKKYYRFKNHSFINYTHFVQYPEQECRKMCEFLGLTFEHDMLNFGQSVDGIISTDESWKGNNKEKVKSMGSDIVLTEEEKRKVEESTSLIWEFWEQKLSR